MLEILLATFMSAQPPPDCRVMFDNAAEDSTLVVKTRGGEVTRVLTMDELPSTPAGPEPRPVTMIASPADDGTIFAAIPEPWDSGLAPAGIGYLYRVTCAGAPLIEVHMVAAGVDFGRVAIARDGRWVVGGWGGLRVLDPVARRLTPLTSPPPYRGPRCWSAEEDRPAPAADVPLVGAQGFVLPTGAPPEEEIAFFRGGACGYEGEMVGARHALLIDRGVIRPMKAIRAVAVAGDGRLLVGDGGGSCEEATPGTLWSSRDGERWTAHTLQDDMRGGIAQLARIGDGPWLAVTSICASGAGASGGDLYRSEDLARWERMAPVPEGFSDAINRGAGVIALEVEDGRAYIAVTSGRTERWFESDDGTSWRETRRRTLRRAPQALAGALGVETIFGVANGPEANLAWTSDGLFRKPRGAGPAPWSRIFPR